MSKPPQPPRPLFNGRQRLLLGIGAIILMPATFVGGIYLGGIWDNYKLTREQKLVNSPSTSETELRKAEQKLLDERTILDKRIAALEQRNAALEQRNAIKRQQ